MALPAEDVVAIEQLCARYNHAVDAGDGPGFAATFTEDGVLVVNQRFEGHAALAAFAESVPTRIPRPRHIVSNVLVDGDSNAASAKAYLQLYARTGDGGGLSMISSGVYADSLRRKDGQWLFIERVFAAD
ncbi:nuclear transport factor 2 family protein [Jatrophihabitans sp. DSM 45814]